jgi:predicted Fe-Mo cluster-binding NifX family protein
MGVSRPTFGRIISSARQKIANAILNGKALSFGGGHIQSPRSIPMIIAAAVHEQQIEDHFGQCQQITLYHMENQAIKTVESFPVPSSIGCRSGLAISLANIGVTHLITGQLGAGVRAAFEGHGIQVFAGISGNPQTLVPQIAAGLLVDSGSVCNHDHHSGDNCCHN